MKSENLKKGQLLKIKPDERGTLRLLDLNGIMFSFTKPQILVFLEKHGEDYNFVFINGRIAIISSTWINREGFCKVLK